MQFRTLQLKCEPVVGPEKKPEGGGGLQTLLGEPMGVAAGGVGASVLR